MDREKTQTPLFTNIRMKLILIVFSSALFAVIVWFVQTTLEAVTQSREKQRLSYVLRLDASISLTVLRLLQGALTLASSSALMGSLELIQYCLSARPDGLSYVEFLILSPATGLFGALRILFAIPVRVSHRLWALLK